MSKLIRPSDALKDQMELSGKKVEEESNLNGDNFEKSDNYYEPYSFSDIEENIGSITSLENRISDALSLLGSIVDSKGMNQQFAMEAAQILPGFGKVPVEYYSVSTTATRYKLSLEELSGGIWALIIAGIASVIALIYKLIDHFFGGKSRSSGSDENSYHSYTAEDIKIVEKKVEAINRIVVNKDDLDKIIWDSLNKEESIDDRPAALFSNDPFFIDIINKINGNDSTYVKTMQLIYNNNTIAGIERSLHEIVKVIEKEIDTAETVAIKSPIATNFNLEPKLPVTVELATVHGKTVIIKDLGSAIINTKNRVKETYDNMSNYNKSRFFEFSVIYSRYLEILTKSKIEEILTSSQTLHKTLINVTDRLDDLKDKAEIISRSGAERNFDRLRNYSSELSKLISTVKEEISSILVVIREINEYAGILIRLGNTLVNRVLKNSLRILEHEAKNPYVKLDDDVLKIIAELKALNLKN